MKVFFAIKRRACGSILGLSFCKDVNIPKQITLRHQFTESCKGPCQLKGEIKAHKHCTFGQKKSGRNKVDVKVDISLSRSPSCEGHLAECQRSILHSST